MENHILIADFMGFKPVNNWYNGQDIKKAGIPFNPGIQGNITRNLKFSSSWDWLMPVIEKIYNIGIDDENNLIGDITHSLLDFDLKNTYLAVIEFIKYFNYKTGNDENNK